ncbi:MAG: hypothetical protein AB1767_00185 [Bacillota bacterium]
MKKISDRFLLGLVAGLGGNLVKVTVERAAIPLLGFNETGAKKAGGIFLKKKDVSSSPGKVLGLIADNMIAAGLGITCIYWLTLMGKDNYLLKGATLGAAEWTALYGVTSQLGATNIFPTTPKNGLVSFLSHLAFGATKTAIAVNLGDSRLFQPQNLTKTMTLED